METNTYFSVPCRVPVVVEPLPMDTTPPDGEAFEAEIPETFILASDVATLDPASLRAMRSLRDVSNELASYLNLLSRKINAIMGHILVMNDHGDAPCYASAIGASGLTLDDASLQPAQYVRLKLFLREEAVALYCYGQVRQQDGHQTVIEFVRLREQDQELLIRATLHLQAKQLKERASRKDN